MSDEFLETPETTEDTGESNDILDFAREDLLESIFAGEPIEETPAEEQTEDAKPNEEPAKPDGETEGPEAEEEPPTFEVASQKAFFDSDGSLDTERLQNNYFSPEKSFLSHVTSEPKKPIMDAEKPESPEAKYNSSVSNLMQDLPSLIEKDKAEGFTGEETMERLMNTINGYKSEMEIANRVQAELESKGSAYEKELQAVRDERREAKILSNTAELGSTLEGLIPGVSGIDTLTRFTLDKDLGAPAVNQMFMRDNPDFNSLSESEKEDRSKSWFKEFQANKSDLAFAAEFGRMKWLINQLPDMFSHAQKVGASKAGMAKSTGNGKSELTNKQQTTNEGNPLSEFLGIDSVS